MDNFGKKAPKFQKIGYKKIYDHWNLAKTRSTKYKKNPGVVGDNMIKKNSCVYDMLKMEKYRNNKFVL